MQDFCKFFSPEHRGLCFLLLRGKAGQSRGTKQDTHKIWIKKMGVLLFFALPAYLVEEYVRPPKEL